MSDPNGYVWQGDYSLFEEITIEEFYHYRDYNDVIMNDYNGSIEEFEKDTGIKLSEEFNDIPDDIPVEKSDNDLDEIPF